MAKALEACFDCKSHYPYSAEAGHTVTDMCTACPGLAYATDGGNGICEPGHIRTAAQLNEGHKQMLQTPCYEGMQFIQVHVDNCGVCITL